MVTGYNTDVEHDGRVYHVQTEDKGTDNPMIETLVYRGGEILDPRSGRTYRVRLKLEDGGQKLDVRGFIGVSLLGHSLTWLRVE